MTDTVAKNAPVALGDAVAESGSAASPLPGAALPAPARPLPAPEGAAWVALQSSDPEGACAFYAAVLGWTFEPGGGPGALWRALDASGTQLAVVGRAYSGRPSAGVWAPCFAVRDVRVAADLIRAQCGTVAVGPLPLEGGRGVLAADRRGTGFTLWEPPRGHARRGTGTRYRLHSPDPADALAFYAAVLGADPARTAHAATESVLTRGAQRLLSLVPARGTRPARPARPVRGSVPRARGAAADRPVAARARWQPEFTVADVDAAVASALAAGASLLVEDARAARTGHAALRAPDGTVFSLVRG